MRIGTTMGGYDRFGNRKYQKVKDHGFFAVDFNLSDTNTDYYTLPLQEVSLLLRQERLLAQDADVDIWQVHGPWRWPPQDAAEAQRQERMEKMQRSIEMCAELGCHNWVIHPIMPHGEQDRNTENGKKTWELNYRFFRKLLETAKANDVTICLENMPSTTLSLATPQDILQFVKAMDDDHFRICFDTGHAAVASSASVEDAIRELGDLIRVLHVHDSCLGMDLHLIPYQGTINWTGVSDALRDIGFSGVFSLETGAPQKLPTPLFEQMSIAIANIAKEIAK